MIGLISSSLTLFRCFVMTGRLMVLACNVNQTLIWISDFSKSIDAMTFAVLIICMIQYSFCFFWLRSGLISIPCIDLQSRQPVPVLHPCPLSLRLGRNSKRRVWSFPNQFALIIFYCIVYMFVHNRYICNMINVGLVNYGKFQVCINFNICQN